MDKCGQACPYNTLDGCKVKEYRAICPLTNMATPITECKMTNADRIRAMSDEELAEFLADDNRLCPPKHPYGCKYVSSCNECFLEWLQQPSE